MVGISLVAVQTVAAAIAAEFTILTNDGPNAIVDSVPGLVCASTLACFPIPLRRTHRYYPPAIIPASESPDAPSNVCAVSQFVFYLITHDD
jgi:hypothetical protein